MLLDKVYVKNVKYFVINLCEDFDVVIVYIGFFMVLKSVLGGYDGKGQWCLKGV